MTDLGFDVLQEDYGASRVDGMRGCYYELSRVRGMRRSLTVLNATVRKSQTCTYTEKGLCSLEMSSMIVTFSI